MGTEGQLVGLSARNTEEARLFSCHLSNSILKIVRRRIVPAERNDAPASELWSGAVSTGTDL